MEGFLNGGCDWGLLDLLGTVLLLVSRLSWNNGIETINLGLVELWPTVTSGQEVKEVKMDFYLSFLCATK